MATELTRFNEAVTQYRAHRSEIMDAGRAEWGVDPYSWECFSRMSPIEADLWAHIRSVDAVFYPQWPIGYFFADFCNPVAGVVIECDGAAWHTDAAKDAKRQRFIEHEGFTVYRITGKQCQDEEFASSFVREIATGHRLIRGVADWCIAIDAQAKRLVVAKFSRVKDYNENALLDGRPGLSVVRNNKTEDDAMWFARTYSPIYKLRANELVEVASQGI